MVFWIAEAIKKGEGCLAFIDLDNLKKTNDILGHLAGDYAIKYVGEIIRKHSENKKENYKTSRAYSGTEAILFLKLLPIRMLKDEEGNMTHAEFDIENYRAGPYDYVRISLIDKDGNRAWTNPIFL